MMKAKHDVEISSSTEYARRLSGFTNHGEKPGCLLPWRERRGEEGLKLETRDGASILGGC